MVETSPRSSSIMVGSGVHERRLWLTDRVVESGLESPATELGEIVWGEELEMLSGDPRLTGDPG